MNKVLAGTWIRKTLKAELPNAGVYMTDANYAVIDSRWLTNTFWFEFKSWAMKNFVMEWQTFHDCDDKAALLSVLLRLSHAHAMYKRKRKGLSTAEGVTLGTMDYCIDGDIFQGHCINVFISGGKVQYLEPQNGKIIQLTQREKDSCWHVRF